jgi:type IV fimbrial biogenesis protein FimT
MHRLQRALQRHGGFTLTEALIVMAVLVVVASMAMPSMSDLIRDQRIRAASFDLVSDLLLARSEAVKRSGLVSLTGQGQGWQEGWRVTAEEGLHQGFVLQQRAGLGQQIFLRAPARIEFDRNGRTVTGSMVQVEVVDAVRNEARRCVLIDLSGMPQSREGGCS